MSDPPAGLGAPVQVPVIGRAALIQNKRAAARPQDLADVEWLEAHPPDRE